MESELVDQLESLKLTDLSIKDKKTKKKTKQKNPPSKLGYIFDERMLLHRCCGPHPECPERTMGIQVNLKIKNLHGKLETLTTDYINEENLELVHSKKHIENVKKFDLDKDGNPRNSEESASDGDTYNNYFTRKAASLSANSVIIAVDKVLNNEINGAFLAIRPPGHHAFEEKISGFCIYNNVAIGAQYAAKKYGLKRIAIVDWDVHHGNGTQKIFYESSEVLYISIHRFDKGAFYPYSGNNSEIGESKGKGFNINIPWNTKKSNQVSSIGDDEYIYAFKSIIMPILNEFQPELLFVSCGFDAAEGDPLGQLSLSPLGYSYMTKELKDLMKQNLIVVLEGGYNVESIQRSSEAIIRVLLNELPPFDYFREYEKFSIEEIQKCYQPSVNIIRAIDEYREGFAKYWKSLENLEIKKIKNSKFIQEDSDIATKMLEKLKVEKGINISQFLINNYEEVKALIDQNYVLKIKVGALTYLNELLIDKFLRHKRVCYRSTSNSRGFRIEGVSNKPKNLYWNKYEGNLDFKQEKEILDTINLFLKGRKNQREIIDKLKPILIEGEKLSKEGFDILNSEIILISTKKELILKLNNLKDYSISNQNLKKNDIFLKGISNLINFLDENLM